MSYLPTIEDLRGGAVLDDGLLDGLTFPLSHFNGPQNGNL